MDSLSHLLALLAPRCEVNLHCRFGGRWQAGHQQMRSGRRSDRAGSVSYTHLTPPTKA